jgi:hypothetical protein
MTILFQDGHIDIWNVYKLENYDYNIYSKKPNIAKIIIDFEREDYNYDFTREILLDYSRMYGTIFRKYNSRTGRFADIGRADRRNGKSFETKSQRGNNYQENQGNKSRITEQFQLREPVYSDNFKNWFGDWQNDSENASKVVNEIGTRVVEVNNKLVLSGGTYEEPQVHSVLVINAENESKADIYKEVVLNEYDRYKQGKQRFIDCCKVFENAFGKTNIRNYESADFSYHKGRKGSGERAVLPNSFKSYGYTKQFQERGRNNAETERGVSDSVNKSDTQFQMREHI